MSMWRTLNIWTLNAASVIELRACLRLQNAGSNLKPHTEIRSEKIEWIIENIACSVWLSWNVKCTINIHIFRGIYVMPLSGIPFAIPFCMMTSFFVLPLMFIRVKNDSVFTVHWVYVCVVVILLNLHNQLAKTLWGHSKSHRFSFSEFDDMRYNFNFHWINFLIKCCIRWKQSFFFACFSPFMYMHPANENIECRWVFSCIL